MKNLLTLAFIIIISTLTSAQEGNIRDNEDVKAQKVPNSFVILKSGDTIPIAKVHEAKEDYIIAEKPVTYEKFEIASVKIDKVIWPQEINYTNGKSASFYFDTWRFVKLKKKSVFMAELVNGKCDLYLKLNFGLDNYSFFVKRQNEETAAELHKMTGFGKKFNKLGPKFFGDCPQLVEKFKESNAKHRLDYLVDELTSLITFYNESCSPRETK